MRDQYIRFSDGSVFVYGINDRSSFRDVEPLFISMTFLLILHEKSKNTTLTGAFLSQAQVRKKNVIYSDGTCAF